jgi:hypothetical protein
MKFAIRLGLAVATSVALAAAVTPAAFASATPAQHAREAHVVVKNGHLAIAIPLRPGRYAVSDEVLLSASSHASQAAASSAPQIQVRVGPGQCAGFNGEINWYFVATIEAWVINTYGVMWDNCYRYYNWPSTAYVYVSYNELDEPHQNFQAFSVHDSGPAGISKGVNSGDVPTKDTFGPSGIKITACLQSLTGWQCGAGQPV